MEYQETMNVDIEKMASKKQPFWRPIYEAIGDSYFEETKLFPTKFSNQYKNNPNKIQNIPKEIRSALKNDYGTGVVRTGGYYPLKGVRW